MSTIELAVLAVGLSMDAFAVAVCAGLSMSKAPFKKALIVGLWFGAFQALMPLIGYYAAKLFANYIITYDHWVAFTLLSFLGGKMVFNSFKQNETANAKEASLRPAQMLPLALATSVDALAVGISFAFLQVSIVPAVSFIGVTTLVLSMLGVKVGSVFGARFKAKAEFAGGLILVLIGVKILYDHLSAAQG
ncbi:MAG: manganese efflux pump MntP family protein [Oscillospiraceae bacterium]|jgi:putative Mn2+ efflux pump MntP|nr:manganese efflux pump MntP family protein [Oscillospiraceae bacterium]